MTVTQRQKKLYRQLVRMSGARECALNVILVDMGLKDAMTIGFSPGVRKVLRENKFQCELDTSYLVNRIHGVVENTSSVFVPGAEVVKRICVAKGLFPRHLKELKQGTHFRQGLFFGFPLCCILHYCRKAAYEKKTYIDVFRDFIAGIPCTGAVKNLDYRFMGGLVKYFRPVRVTEYIPCSPACAQSAALVDRNLAVLEQLDKKFKDAVVADFNDTYLIYGTSWETIGLVRGRGLKKNRNGSYSMRCISTLPATNMGGKAITIDITPHRSVTISLSSKVVVRSSTPRCLPWSYCFIQPVVPPTEQ